jgi:nitrile hydratase accessory protein
VTQAGSFGGPRRTDEPVFAEPWEARVFAITVWLHGRGLFTWPEWTDALAARIASAQAAGDPDLGDTYYRHWLGALEDVIVSTGVTSAAETARWRSAWQHAVSRTPHGRPIELQPNDFDTGLD